MFKFNIFQKIIQNINTVKYQKQLLNSLNPGDLVWAKMPLSRKELNAVEETHRTRPYLVVYKDYLNIYAYQSSSKQWNRLNNCEEYFINRFRYRQNKNSFINLTKVYKIPLVNLKAKYITLNQFDLKNIQKRLQIQLNKGCSIVYLFSIDIYIVEGDVIIIGNQLYYVYTSDNVYLYCFVIYKKCPKDNETYKKIIINNKTYYTTFKDKVTFKRSTKMDIINIAYPNEIEQILKVKNQSDNKLKNLSKNGKKIETNTHKSIYENGTVFQVGRNKIAYLFEYKNVHYGVDLLMYKIRPKALEIYDIEKRPILEILPLDEYIKIVEFLSLNNVQPLKPINSLYQELRTVIYN